MSALHEGDSSDGDDANLIGLRALGEEEPLVDPNADTFELDLGAGRRVVIPMDRGAQRRGVAGACFVKASHATRCTGGHQTSSVFLGARRDAHLIKLLTSSVEFV